MDSLRAVIYARYSSSSQREESIEAQLNICNAYAERNGYMVIGHYADKAKSGTNDKRPEFQWMIRDSKRKQQKPAQLEADKEELLVRIEEEKLEKPRISAEFMTFWLHKLRALDMRKETHRHMLIDTFVNAVYVHDDKLLLTFNFKNSTRTITFNDAKTATSKHGSDLDCLVVPRKERPLKGSLFSYV